MPGSRSRLLTVLLLPSPFLLATPLCAQEQRTEFLLYKPGDPGATADRAEGFLEDLAEWLGEHVERFAGAAVTGRITNVEEEALRLSRAAAEEQGRPAPDLAIVPAGFYLRHLRKPERAARVVAEVPRFGKRVDRYYLVGRKADGPKSLTALRGKTVHTQAGIDRPYLERVVFPEAARPGEHFELRPSKNLADDVFLMVEGDAVGAEEAPDALLLDEELLQFFAADDLVWPHLGVLWKSDPLPRDLVVALGRDWTEAERTQLEEALLQMSEDESGKELLRRMRSDGFAAPDRDLLARTARAYDRKRKDGGAGGRDR